MKKIEMRYTFSDSTVRIIYNKCTVLMIFYCKKQYNQNSKPQKYNTIKYTDFFTEAELLKIKNLVVISVKTRVEDLRDCAWHRSESSTVIEAIEKVFYCHFIED